MCPGVERIGNYVMSVLDEAAEHNCSIVDLHFTAFELLNIASSATYDSTTNAAVSAIGLAGLHPKTLLCEGQLAGILDHDPRTIRAMVSRRELPAPVDLGNKKVWFAGRVLDFLSERMDRAEQAANRRIDQRQNLIGGAA